MFAHPPPLTEGIMVVCSGEAAASGSAHDVFNNIFFATYCKEYQLFTQTTYALLHQM